MKKILGFAAVAAMGLASTSALASKARILALGDEVEDNYFIEDSRSIFTNAAYVNDYSDTLMLEWGGNGAFTILDQNDNAKAMGGFLKKSGNFTYGIYLGNESNVSSFLRIVASPDSPSAANLQSTYLATADNQTDFFVGSTMSNGIKWGWNFLWTSDKNEANTAANSKDSAMATRFGLLGSNWEGFVNLSLNSESEKKNLTTPTKFDGKLGFLLGGSYKLDSGVKLHAAYKTFKWEQTGGNQTAGVKTDGSFTRYFIGAGKVHKLSETDSVFFRAVYDALNVELKYASGKAELDRKALPLVAGYEVNATSWLTLRGSVSYHLLGNAESKNLATVVGSEQSTNPGAANFGLKGLALASYDGSTTDGKKSIANSTSVNAGASLLFGNLTVDGFIGTTAASRAATTQSKQGVLALDNLMTRVGMTYKF
ncbi:hypothetical protein BIY24_14040 [Halobacteriovorax marinus]|uniref:hypothetical protein n=1 Tax=Halobacteriovorax marinus TaxID=97084 RepID=UPI000BC35E84|nr:hypothetical protein [Halobacteriovorax marinus]ATH09025.1 hypothetical protein BIY24_14040 [Halobacteriovorax marinus]